MTLASISQSGIVIFGGAAIWLLVQRKDRARRWGYIFGAISIPFLVYANIEAQQWGMFVLTVWHAVSWAVGIYNFWIKP